MQLALATKATTPRIAWQPTVELAVANHAADRSPPVLPRARTLSGRPSCWIYPSRRAWILEFELPWGGWIERSPAGMCWSDTVEARRLAFPTLAAAIGYAERHGLDYRIVQRRRRTSARRRSMRGDLPRSWTARLMRNGEKGEKGGTYHG